MLRLVNVSAGYNGTNVLHEISFSLEKGESLSIIGPNSCGKTTLLRVIAGILEFEGEIMVKDFSLKSMKRKEIASHIAMMKQLPSISFPYSVEETVMMGRYRFVRDRFFAKPEKKDHEIVEKIMEDLNLLEIRKKSLDQLSGGQIQRVFLAHTFAQEPQIILLDEPTNHMDMRYQIEMVEHIRNWASQDDHLAIGVFHDLNLAVELTDNLLFMKDGRLHGMGKAEELISSGFLKEIYGLDVVEFMVKSYRRWLKLGGSDV